jgi:hypothetical protein
LIKWPGADKLITILEETWEMRDIPYYDFSAAIRDKDLYKDHDHLNTEGVITFATEYLDPLFQNVKSTVNQ